MNIKKLIKILIIILIVIVCISVAIYIFNLNNHRDSSNLVKVDYHSGKIEAEDTVKWSYEVDLDNKKTTKYCSSTGLLRNKFKIWINGYNKRYKRNLTDNEYNTITYVLSNYDKYKELRNGNSGVSLNYNGKSYFVSIDDPNISGVRTVTYGY